MDELTPFKGVGDVNLTVPLAQGFDKIVFDFVRMAAFKSGFDGENADKIAERISRKVFQDFHVADEQGNRHKLEISMAHRPGQMTIKTKILGLNLYEEEQFKTLKSQP